VEEIANITYFLELQKGQVGLGWKVHKTKKKGTDEHNDGTQDNKDLYEFKDSHLQHTK